MARKPRYTSDSVVEVVDRLMRNQKIPVTYYRPLITRAQRLMRYYQTALSDWEMYGALKDIAHRWMNFGMLDDEKYSGYPIKSGCTFAVSYGAVCLNGKTIRV